MLFSDDICMIIKALNEHLEFVIFFFTFEFLISDWIGLNQSQKNQSKKKIFLFRSRDRLKLNEEIKKEMEVETEIQIDGFDAVLSIKQSGSKTV